MKRRRPAWILLMILSFLASACGGPTATAGTIEITVHVDGRNQTQAVPAGSTAQQALQEAGIQLGELDRVDPPGYTVVTDGTEINVTRVVERFEIEQVVVPFERQTLKNESLPSGETRLIQAGVNGKEEITYRVVEEEGVEVSRNPVKRQIIDQPQPEIVMVGSQASYTPLQIAGKLAYLSGGNAWIMESNTGNRRPLVVSGDLDGRVFRLSPSGRWLLFSRQAADSSGDINSLWIISTTDPNAEPIDLEVRNVVHFGDWAPASDPLMLAYSTVEPSPAAPGWQANNDLELLVIASDGRVIKRTTLIGVNAGGQYGWWGTDFQWASDGVHLAYARAEGVGQVDIRQPSLDPLHEEVPFQTLGDWAWVPGIAWGQDNRTLYMVDHGAPLGIESPAASPVFNLVVLPAEGGAPLPLAERTGMFSLPNVSPAEVLDTGEVAYSVAYYQATSPLDSRDSSYRLMLIDRDGSNRQESVPRRRPARTQGRRHPTSGGLVARRIPSGHPLSGQPVAGGRDHVAEPTTDGRRAGTRLRLETMKAGGVKSSGSILGSSVGKPLVHEEDN